MRIRWSSRQRRGPGAIGVVRRTVAALAALAVGLGIAGATASTAQAATPGIEIAVLHDGAVIGDGATIPEGAEITLRVQYDAAQPIAGTSIVITLPADITVAGELPGNEAIDSVVQNGDGTLTVTFKDPIPSDITEGAFALKLTAGQVDGDTESPVTWKIGDDEGGVRLIVEDEVTPPATVEDGYAKSVNPGNLDGFVVTSGSPDYAFEGLRPDIAEQLLSYTLVLSSAEARSGYTISDELAAGLGFVPGSFTAELTTAEGSSPYSFSPAVSGNSFSGTVDVPAQSTLRISYQVRVTDAPALEALLRAQYEARGNTPGNYEIQLPNHVVFGGQHERSVNVRLRGNIPGVWIGDHFAKRGEWTLRDVVANADGTLRPAAEMVYTLHADLTPWDGRNANFTLDRNVVIRDTLIEQASWKTGEGFIELSGTGPLTGLTEAAGFTGTAADFAADRYVGQYALLGRTLLVNVGKDNTTAVDVRVRAQLDTVAGLPGSGETTVVDGTRFPWNNRAQFFAGTGDPVNRDHNAGVVVLPEGYEDGVNDSAAFSKTARNEEVRVNPGERAQVPYRFEIDTSKPNIDPLRSRIVDELDTTVFDVSDPAAIPVSGSYGSQALSQEHFALSADEQGRLVIQLSEAGKTLVASLPKHQRWTVDVVFTTVPFDGKQTFEIYNRATLHSAGADWDYWSDDDAEATSYGDEAELRKRLYDAETGSWTPRLEAGIREGAFVDDRFVYSIELIPRGDYGRAFPVSIFTREDVLPESVEFLGFVGLDEDGKPSAEVLSSESVDMNGNVLASYADGVVTIRQQEGTSLNPGQGRIVTTFAVRAKDASQPIVNTIAGSEAIIVPVGDPSVDIEKWSDEGEAPAYDDRGALTNDGFAGDFDRAPGKPLSAGTSQQLRFTVSNDGREELRDVTVSDELIAGGGELRDLSCVFPDGSEGTRWPGPFAIGAQFSCTGTLPALAPGQSHGDRATVTAVGAHSGTSVDDADEWHGFTESVPGTSTPPSPGGDPAQPAAPHAPAAAPALASTGGAPALWLGLTALLVTGIGASLVLVRRRRSGGAGAAE
ncbi:hypothetical protein [Leucobacter massiliensis]|uniref:hypothetical protein n=1 Tax=Leucobacter massiliensis TaxID=1686285 RepID=UPI0011B25DF3|nr:hypothetical protein [Leucobacter massiliensis]